MRQEGYQIWSTDLSQEAVCLTKEALEEEFHQINASETKNSFNNIIPDKLAVVFGTEAVGCTAEILNASDKRVYLPLRGTYHASEYVGHFNRYKKRSSQNI